MGVENEGVIDMLAAPFILLFFFVLALLAGVLMAVEDLTYKWGD